MSILLKLLAAAVAVTVAAAPVEREVEVPGPLGPLKGTLLAPAGKPKAVVVIIPGSGPTDRDGNSPLGVKAQPYKLLAEDLAARGVASVRIDKRGMFGSRGAIADANDVTVPDYAADVHQWVKAAKAQTGLKCVWLAGHSEGGLVALAAAQDPADLCGLVLIAAPGRRFGDVLRAQLKANPANAPLLDQANSAIDALEAGRRVDVSAMNPALLPLFAPQVQNYVINLLSYDPARLAAAIHLPMLILGGEADLQVLPEDARRLAATNPRARLVLVPGVNHVLKAVGADRQSNLAAYADPALPLAPGVGDAIASFILKPPKR